MKGDSGDRRVYLVEVRQQVVNAPQRADMFFCSDYLGQLNQPLCAVVISTNQLCYNVGITDDDLFGM